MSFMTEGDYNYQVMATSLDGSDRQDIGYGDWPGLSPDGSTLVSTGQTGLVMVELATNQTTPIAGTTISDRGVIWSPDGKQIAFTRGPASGLIGAPGPYSIWVAGADGSNLRQVTPGSDANHAMAWMPAGDRILYTVEKADGAFVRTIDVQTGEVVSLFESNYTHSTVALSPDGQQVAFEEMLPGDRYALYIADLDGSNRRLLANPSPVVATIPLWSPDGRWLAVGVSDPDAKPPLPALALIEVDTCQVVPLPNLTGYGYTWIR
jgi:Tol biopolymer transport system component